MWRDVKLPDGKVLHARASSAMRTNVVEHPELVAQRLVRLAELVGRERVIGEHRLRLRADAFLHARPPSIWAKLKALAEGARLATRQLWG